MNMLTVSEHMRGFEDCGKQNLPLLRSQHFSKLIWLSGEMLAEKLSREFALVAALSFLSYIVVYPKDFSPGSFDGVAILDRSFYVAPIAIQLVHDVTMIA